MEDKILYLTLATFLLSVTIACLMGWIYYLKRSIDILLKYNMACEEIRNKLLREASDNIVNGSKKDYKDLIYHFETLERETKAQLYHLEAVLIRMQGELGIKEKERTSNAPQAKVMRKPAPQQAPSDL